MGAIFCTQTILLMTKQNILKDETQTNYSKSKMLKRRSHEPTKCTQKENTIWMASSLCIES